MDDGVIGDAVDGRVDTLPDAIRGDLHHTSHGQQQVLAQIHDPLLSSGFAIANGEEKVGEAGVPPDHDRRQEEMEKPTEAAKGMGQGRARGRLLVVVVLAGGVQVVEDLLWQRRGRRWGGGVAATARVGRPSERRERDRKS